ncbi:hypothetical protein C9J85_17055 [Haloferax sp. wsp5]|nr:hypothetical protein C9J85_17055 [Haloferax sp. wsp5]
MATKSNCRGPAFALSDTSASNETVADSPGSRSPTAYWVSFGETLSWELSQFGQRYGPSVAVLVSDASSVPSSPACRSIRRRLARGLLWSGRFRARCRQRRRHRLRGRRS